MGTSSAVRQFVTWAPLAAMLIVLLPVVAAAQEPVKSFDQLDTRLKPGDTVWVTDAQGREVKGKIRELTPSSLMLDKGDGQTLQAADVARITQRQGHKIGKGALWGLLIGGAAGAIWGVAAVQDCSDCWPAGGAAAAGAGIWGGVGAGIGALLGATMPGKELVVYPSPAAGRTMGFSLAPVITPRTKGVVVALTF